MLAGFGFEAVRCESLTFAEQVRLFGSAEAVVGPHGAGLANLTFCPPGTKVIELMAPCFVQPIYWFTATSCGHDYATLIAAGDDAPLANRTDAGGWQSGGADGMTVDADRLRDLCALMGL